MAGPRVQPLEEAADDSGKDDGGGATLMEWLSYRIDSVVSRQSGQVKGLFVVSIVFVLIAGAAEMEVTGIGLDDGVWEAWNYMADPGTHSECVNCVEWCDGSTCVGEEPEDGDGNWKRKVNWGTRVLAIGIAWGGILFFAIVIGFIIDAIQEKMESLKKGKSDVVEEGHTVMLGWTQLSVDFIKEICDANESEGGGVIVVLADQDKQELERSFRMQVKRKELLGTRVVFRKGLPTNQSDLVKCASHTARAILILATMGENGIDADTSDSTVVRTILGLHGLPSKLSGHIVAEICDIDNEPLAHMVGGTSLETIVSHDLIGRLMLMSARQPGLAKIYSEVLGFDGDEFYMETWPAAAGKKFTELCTHFADAIPLGVRTAAGEILLNPGDSHVMAVDDELIVLAEDDDTYKFNPKAVTVNAGELPDFKPPPRNCETILMAGWRRDIRDILLLLDSMVVHGSEVHMLAEVPLSERKNRLLADGLDPDSLRNVKLRHFCGRCTSRKVLCTLDIQKYTSCMILADEANEGDVMSSDSHTLATLLLLRDIQEDMILKRGPPKIKTTRRSSSVVRADGIAAICPCISEILDSRTQKTVQANQKVQSSSDFVQSNQMISQILSMVAENRGVKRILSELLGPVGSELVVNDSKLYVDEGEEVSFFTIALRAQKRGEICCGYQTADETIINPRDKQVVKDWTFCDLVILGSAEADQGSRKPSVITPLDDAAAEGQEKKRRGTVYSRAGIIRQQYATLEGKLENLEGDMKDMVSDLKAVFAEGM